MTEKRIQKLKRRLQAARYRLLSVQPDFAAPLRDMLYVAAKEVYRISTNGSCIYFDPDWLQKLGDAELDFILAHQLMHVQLGHIKRPQYYKGDKFHLACDIVANANLSQLGWNYDRLPHIGKIYCETFFPKKSGSELTAQEAMACVPFDPAVMSPGVRRNYRIDSEDWWEKELDRGEGGVIVLRPGEEDPFDLPREETAGDRQFRPEIFPRHEEKKETEETPAKSDSHAPGGAGWDQWARNGLMSLRNAKKRAEEAGEEGDFSERAWQQAHHPALDWRMLLNTFVQEDICDYSFTPPDRRLPDSEFFLPDYNVAAQRPREVLFLVDTSGSIDEETLSAVYAELCAAFNQWDGGLVGLLGFFDTQVRQLERFETAGDLRRIMPAGGGGTDFHSIFHFVGTRMASDPPASIVIFTDGQGDFPDEAEAQNIPVLWLFTQKDVQAPWGRAAYVGGRRKE